MMPEISLNILDVTENSVRAGASRIEVFVDADTARDSLTVTIRDNGCGMTAEQVAQVTDPFFTTRKTRRIGLGVPFFKLSAEQTGGSFRIESEPGAGTTVTAVYVLSSIDRMPLGDIGGTMKQLIVMHEDRDFTLRLSLDGRSFTLDTAEFREVLEGIPFSTPDVQAYIDEYLKENISETLDGTVL